jgi:hypothetical protein
MRWHCPRPTRALGGRLGFVSFFGGASVAGQDGTRRRRRVAVLTRGGTARSMLESGDGVLKDGAVPVTLPGKEHHPLPSGERPS